MTRAFIFVLDSFGIGGAADAARFGDQGSNTLGHIVKACSSGEADRDGVRSGPLKVPNMMALGLAKAASIAAGNISGNLDEISVAKSAFFGAADEISSGKDTPSGHWEIAAVPVRFDWGYFPQTIPTFPTSLTSAIVEQGGLPGILGDRHASGMASHPR